MRTRHTSSGVFLWFKVLRLALRACNLIISHSCIKSLFAHNSKHIDLGMLAWTWWSTSSHSRERSSLPFKLQSEQNTDEAKGFIFTYKGGLCSCIIHSDLTSLSSAILMEELTFYAHFGDSNVKQSAYLWDELVNAFQPDNPQKHTRSTNLINVMIW